MIFLFQNQIKFTCSLNNFKEKIKFKKVLNLHSKLTVLIFSKSLTNFIRLKKKLILTNLFLDYKRLSIFLQLKLLF